MIPAAIGTIRVLAVTCLLTLVACTQANAPTAQLKDVRPAREVDVRAAVEDFKSAISRRDVDKILTFYAADGWQIPPSGEIARTDAERRALWTAITSLPIAQDAIDVADRIDMAESGDLAVQYGEFRQVMFDGKGNYKSLQQKFVTSWRRQSNGIWKITVSMATVDKPA
jgi:ketosteroid isomerase-like protein